MSGNAQEWETDWEVTMSVFKKWKCHETVFCLLQISAFSIVANSIRVYAAVVHMVLFHIMVEATVPLMHQHRED